MIDDASRVPSMLQQANASYHDLSSLNGLRQLGQRDEQAALQAAARQFESHFLKTLIKTMREANEALGENELFDGESVGFYQEMHDEQLASTLSAQNSLGLAELMIRQLSQINEAPANSKPFSNGVGQSNAIQPANQRRSAEGTAVAEIKAQRVENASADRSSGSTPAEFFASVLPHAEKAARALGVPTEILLAQAALETGWGKSAQGPQPNHRYFGIKADSRWQGDVARKTTIEFEQEQPKKLHALFRDYPNGADAFSDYVKFIKESPRYESAVKRGDDAREYIHGLQKAGYATDPQYVDKVMRIHDGEMFKSALSEARKLLSNPLGG